MPKIEDIQRLHGCVLPSSEDLKNKEQELRNKLNDMLNKGEIDLYPAFKEKDDLIQLLVSSNNIKEFKYD